MFGIATKVKEKILKGICDRAAQAIGEYITAYSVMTIEERKTHRDAMYEGLSIKLFEAVRTVI